VLKTADTVEDKNKNVYIITGQLKLKHICAILRGHDVLSSPVRHFGGTCPPVPAGFTPLHVCKDTLQFFCLLLLAGEVCLIEN